jgi:hypothetical protein
VNRSLLLAAHRPIPGTCVSRSVSGACVMERCSPQSVPFPPQSPRKIALLCSTGSRVLRHSPTSPARSCPPFGLWPLRTGLDRATKACRRSPGSRACCFSACQVLRLRRTEQPLATGVVVVLPSSLPERSRHPDPSAFRSSIARPTDTFVYASSDTSRCRLQDSRPGWIRCFPFL